MVACKFLIKSTLGLVTFVPHSLPGRAIHEKRNARHNSRGWQMASSSVEMKQRRASRTKAVLPVRVKGKDSAGNAFEEIAHTLDVTQTGVRLGSMRRALNVADEVTVFYRQRKTQFRVVWTKKMQGSSEYQVGLQALTQDREAWGLSFTEAKTPLASQPVTATA